MDRITISRTHFSGMDKDVIQLKIREIPIESQ